MKFVLALKWLGFETGLMTGETKSKYDLISIELTLLTIGLKFAIGF